MNHNCLICASPTYCKTDAKGRSYHFCPNCRFISLDPSFYLSEEKEKKRYNLHNNGSDNSGYIQWLQSFLQKAVLPFISPCDRILDFGSGPVPQLKILLENKGYKVDIYDKYFYDHPFSGTYKMITATEVVEHLRDPLSVLKILSESLEPQGYLAIKTAWRPEKDEDFLSWWYKEDSTHIVFFSKKSFSLLSDRLGLNIYYSDNNSIVIFRN